MPSDTFGLTHVGGGGSTGRLQKRGLNVQRLCLRGIQIPRTSMTFDSAMKYILVGDRKESYL
jgi:hypothetical protein